MANILVVEDEDALREILVDHLADEGHEIAEARNGREALDLYASFKPNLIISDINMPVMDGYEFLSTLQKTYPEIDDTPFFFLSALADSKSQIKGLDFGIDEYLCKPVDFNVLSARIALSLKRQDKIKEKIRSALERSKAASEDPGTTSKTNGDQPAAADPGPRAKRTGAANTGLLASKRPKLSSKQKQDILSINTAKNLHFANLINKLGRNVNISRIFLKKNICDGIYSEICSSQFEPSFLSEASNSLLQAVEVFLERRELSKEKAIIIPAFFHYIINPEIRKKYIQRLDDIEQKYSVATISEIVNIPDRLATYTEILQEISCRTHVQIIEIRKYDQIKDIDLNALRIGAITIDYSHVVDLRKSELSMIKKRIADSEINFYVKEITEGKISQAQSLGADLLSVSIT